MLFRRHLNFSTRIFQSNIAEKSENPAAALDRNGQIEGNAQSLGLDGQEATKNLLSIQPSDSTTNMAETVQAIGQPAFLFSHKEAITLVGLGFSISTLHFEF